MPWPLKVEAKRELLCKWFIWWRQGAEVTNWRDWNRGGGQVNTMVCGFVGHPYRRLRFSPTGMYRDGSELSPQGWLGSSIYSLSSITHWLKVVPGLRTPQHFRAKQACLHSGVLLTPHSKLREALGAGAQQALSARQATCLELPCLESGRGWETSGIIKD